MACDSLVEMHRREVFLSLEELLFECLCCPLGMFSFDKMLELAESVEVWQRHVLDLEESPNHIRETLACVYHLYLGKVVEHARVGYYRNALV